MDHAHAQVSYKTYWTAWLGLLAITLVMVFIRQPVVLLAGIAVKASVILLLFMHLKYERRDLLIGILAAIFVTAALLYGLIAADGKAM